MGGAVAEENRPFTDIQASMTFVRNGRKLSFRALVDTGAQGTLVSERVLEQLQTRPTAGGLFINADGSRIRTGALRLRIGVSPFPLRELRVMVMTTCPEGYDAILGMDYLLHHHFEINHGQFRIIA